MDLRRCVASLLLSCVFPFLALGLLAANQKENAGHIHVGVNMVLVDVAVEDHQGQGVDGLTQNDFEIREDGKPQAISYFDHQNQLPLAVALVVDVSGSMTEFMAPLRVATLSALHSMKPADQVALFEFSDKVQVSVELTRDKPTVSDALEAAAGGGRTNINDALYEAARYLKEKAPIDARRVIILVSDNVDNVPAIPDPNNPNDPLRARALPSQVQNEILQASTTLESLQVGRVGQTLVITPLGEQQWVQDRDDLHKASLGLVHVARLAPETGGETFDANKYESLDAAVGAIFKRIETRYTLGYYPAHPLGSGRFHRLQVRLNDAAGRSHRKYKVLTRSGYFSMSRDRETTREEALAGN
ncbi:MAG: VWA domain-containing protein [Candidatus Acidiferrales bacterium]